MFNKIFLKIFFSASIFILLSSCSNELDILDDWKEITVVYGLLDPSDTANGKPQYIKINKAYLGEGNALEMAQNFDSTNYANQLTVKIEKWLNSNLTNTYILEKDTSIEKEPGIFSYPKQVLYTLNNNLDENAQYHLIITNNNTNNSVTAKTNLVKKFTVLYPTNVSTIGMSTPGLVRIKWISSPNGKLYQLTIRFNYTEKDLATNTSMPKYVDWVFPTQKSASAAGGESMETSFIGNEFYAYLQRTLSVNQAIQRIPGNLDFKISCASEDFTTYMEVNAPSAGILQEKPLFSNIENGVGLFSARTSVNINNRPLSANSLDSLYAGRYTYQLGFCSPTPSSLYFCN